MSDDRETTPPGPADAEADAFGDACRHDEWSTRLENVARLHEWHARGRRGTIEE
jgi:hypothetical protein